jgi:hypothetical protein
MKTMHYSKVHIMQKERDPLNLGSLPAVAPAADGWPSIKAELEKNRQRRRRAGFAGGALAAAAALLLAVGVFIQQPAPTPVASATATAAATDDAAPETLDSLISLSQQLESRIRDYRSDVGGMPTNSLVYQVELEDLVAQVDEELSMNPDSTELWSQRVNLLLDIAQLYQNQLRRDYQRMASL